MSIMNVVSVVAAFAGGAVFAVVLIHRQTLKGMADQRISRLHH